MNGILYRVDNNCVSDYDRRECVWGYKRVLTNVSEYELVNCPNNVNIKPNDLIYVYTLPRIQKLLNKQKVILDDEFTPDICDKIKNNKLPFNKNYLILTYAGIQCILILTVLMIDKIIKLNIIDVILKGCKELVDESYAIEFIKTTYLWRKINNDRDTPIRKAFDLTKNEISKHDELYTKYCQEAHNFDYINMQQKLKNSDGYQFHSK